MNTILTQAVLAYQRTGDGWPDLLDRIRLYVYEFPDRWSDWDEDRRSEFFLAFQGRIPGLVERYRPDFSFETYLASTLRWFMKTFTEQRFREEHYRSWAEQECRQRMQFTVFEAAESSPAFGPDPGEDGDFEVDDAGRLKNATFRRRLLYALLLKAADVDPSRIPELARRLDVDPDWLDEVVRRAREDLADKIDQRERLRRRRNECWFRLDAALRRLRAEREAGDADQCRKWEGRVRTWRNRYEGARRRIGTLDVSTPHHRIGRLLDTPPGTVSSGLFYLRRVWRTMERGDPPPAHLHPRRPAPLDLGQRGPIESPYGHPPRHGQPPQEDGTRSHPRRAPHPPSR